MPYTQGRACSDVVAWSSENHVNQMARLTDFELDSRKSTMWSSWHAHKAMNDIMNDNRPC